MSASAKDTACAPENVSGDDALEAIGLCARKLFERQQQRVQQLEEDLTRQVETAIEEIEFGHAFVEERENQFAQLDEKLAKLARERDQALEARSEAESLLDEARAAISQVSHDQHDLRVQLSQCHKQLNARADELKELRARLRASSGESSPRLSDELGRLEAERDALREQLDEARQQLDIGAAPVDSREMDELRERFETAVQEIRELKKRNGELNDQLASQRIESSPQDDVAGDGFDWESQKRRLMQQLEEDFDESDTRQFSDKLTVEGTIRITDKVIAEKDREIADLKTLLEEQSSNIGDMAVGANAIAGFLDQDELICQERESLKRLQEEWRERLRQAEIDISVERAKLGRERTELQSQILTIDQQRKADQSLNGGEHIDHKQPRGRWMKRLGLKDE